MSHQAVSKAAKAGRLAGAIVTKGGKEGLSSFEAADREWNANTDQSKPSNSVTGQPKRKAGSSEAPYAPREDGPTESDAPAPERQAAGQASSYTRARAIREGYMAKEAKLSFDLRAGNLVDAESVRRALFEKNREARDMLLALPDRTAPLIVGLTDQHEIHKIIFDEVRRVCLALSKTEAPAT